MKEKQLLASILILALILRIVFALIVPVFEKPDEDSHFEYIKFVAENNKLPVQEAGNLRAEFFQPPFYHVLASFFFKFISLFTDEMVNQVILLRFLSIIVSMFTLYVIYKIAKLLFKNNNLIFGILAFAAFLPSHINMNSTVTNANFGDLLSTLIIYFALRIIEGKDKEKIILILGLIAGLALITRLSILPAILTIPFIFLIKYYPKIKPNIKNIIKPLIIIGIIALVISGWHLLRNFTLYGDFLGINAMKLASLPDDITVNPIFIARLLGWTFITFWAAFGRTNGIFLGNLESTTGITIFAISYLALLIITLAAIYGLYIFYKKFRKNKNLLTSLQKKSFIMFIIFLALLGFSFISFNLYDFQPQGRLFYPTISIISILFTFGIFSITKQSNWEKFFKYYLAFFIVLNIASIINILYFY